MPPAPVPLTESYMSADTSVEILEITVGDVLRRAAAEFPDGIALVYAAPGDESRPRWTFAELLAESERCARALLQLVEPGEHVALWAPNNPQWVVLQYGAALAGVVLVTVNPAYRARELEYVLRQSRSSAIFLMSAHRGNQMLETLREVQSDLPHLRDTVLLDQWEEFLATAPDDTPLPEVRPDDAVQIQYTSGTTGFPKGALLRHRGLANNPRLAGKGWDIQRGDASIIPLPLFHTGGCVSGILAAHNHQATAVVASHFDAKLMLDLFEQERGTFFVCVPTMLIAMMEQPDFRERDLSSWRAIGCGGSTVPADLVRFYENDLGVKFSIVFGQTESSPIITQCQLDDAPEDKAETLGSPIPQVEVRIADPATNETVPVGAVGEICARGFNVMKGYYDMPEATAHAIDAEGWLHTGDLGSMDERGYLRIGGRVKEMIIRGGENIYPREIEDVLFSHPDVAEIAVVGLPDPKWGETIAAFVRPAEGARPTEDGLQAWVREQISPHKAPTTWVFVDEFPLTPSGKIQKFVLRDQFLARTQGELSAAGPL